VKFHHALQIALSSLALFEHVVLTANPLMEHLTAPSDFEPLAAVRFVFELFAISRPSVDNFVVSEKGNEAFVVFQRHKRIAQSLARRY
jgi:hypothetical protein